MMLGYMTYGNKLIALQKALSPRHYQCCNNIRYIATTKIKLQIKILPHQNNRGTIISTFATTKKAQQKLVLLRNSDCSHILLLQQKITFVANQVLAMLRLAWQIMYLPRHAVRCKLCTRHDTTFGANYVLATLWRSWQIMYLPRRLDRVASTLYATKL